MGYNYLGPQREQLYGLPIISNSVPIDGDNDDDRKGINPAMMMIMALMKKRGGIENVFYFGNQ